jgi:hypothetical protein
VQKGSLQPVSISENLQKIRETCKNHSNLSVCQKNMYDIPKCSEKHDLHVYVKFMHVYTTLTPAEIEELIGTPYGKLGFVGLLL